MENKEKKKLTIFHKIGYGLGDAGGCLTFVFMGKYFTKYCTNALGIDAGLVATLWIIWNVWDFLNDPLMGALMDKVFAKNKNPKGKFRPWLLRSAPLIFVSFVALVTVPQFFKGVAVICAIFVLKILYELTYTMFNIPMGSLLSAMSTNDEERASLSSWRGIGSGIGNMLPPLLALPLIEYYGYSSNIGYAIGGTICAAIGLILCLAHYFMTTERKEVKEEVPTEDVKVSDILKVFKVNKAFLALCLHGVFICFMQYCTETLGIYMYEDVLGNGLLSTMGMAVTGPFMVLIFVFGSKMSKKIGLVNFIRYSLIVGSVLYISLFAYCALTEMNAWVFLIWSGIAMGIASVSIYLQWGLVGEAIDYNKQLTGKRTEGSIYGTFNLSRRIGQTIGTSLPLFIIDIFGYNGNLVVQSDTTKFVIMLLSTLVPAIGILGSWVAFKYVWKIKKIKKETTNTNDQLEGE